MATRRHRCRPTCLAVETEREPLNECLTCYIGFLVAKAHQRICSLFSHELAKAGVGVPSFAVLQLLDESGPMSQHQLGLKLRIDRTTMVKIVGQLVKARMARRKDHPHDRRIYLVQITSTGRSKLNAMKEIADRMEKNLLSGFGEDEILIIHRALFALAS